MSNRVAIIANDGKPFRIRDAREHTIPPPSQWVLRHVYFSLLYSGENLFSNEPDSLVGRRHKLQISVLKLARIDIGSCRIPPTIVNVRSVDTGFIKAKIELRVSYETLPIVVFYISLNMKKDIAVEHIDRSTKLISKITAISDVDPPLARVIIIAVDDRNAAEYLFKRVLYSARLLKLSLPTEDEGMDSELHRDSCREGLCPREYYAKRLAGATDGAVWGSITNEYSIRDGAREVNRSTSRSTPGIFREIANTSVYLYG